MNAFEDLHIKDYIDVVIRRRDIIIIFFVMVVTVVALGSFIMRPVYRATSIILIDPESPNILTTTGAVELQSQNYYSYREYYQSQAEILTSYSLIKKVFDDFRLGESREYARAKEPIRAFLKNIKVEPIRDTRLLKLNVDNRDPKLAADIANRIADLFVMRNLYYISKNELMNLLKNEYLKLESKMSDNEKIYKSGHPEMIRLQKEMAEMVSKIEEEKRSVYNFGNIEEYTKKDSQYALAGFKANNITIQDRAEVPIKPVRPKKMLNIALAIIVGMFGGLGLAYFMEYLDDSIRSTDEIEKITGWPILGNVPKIGGKEEYREAEKDLFVDVKPRDPISEIYRIVRTRILFSSTDEHQVRCIFVTSPGPQEGKTTTLCNIGIAMAQNKKKVLLIDADMRRPRLHDIFNKPNEIGLSSILSGQAILSEALQSTGIEGLSIISGGIVPVNPSELLAGNKTKELIIKAKEQFDFIIFDTPPIAMLTDAAIIAGAVDGAVIVIESGKTSKRTLTRVHNLLEHAKTRIIGMVLNKANIIGDEHYYYSYYYGKEKSS